MKNFLSRSTSYLISLFLSIVNICLCFSCCSNSLVEIYSENLIKNNNFKSEFNCWKHDQNIIITNDNNQLFACINSPGTVQTRFGQDINTISGHVYCLKFTLNGKQNGAFVIFRDNIIGKEQYFNCSGDFIQNKRYFWTFKPVSTGNNTIYFSTKQKGSFFFSNIKLFDTRNFDIIGIAILVIMIFLIAEIIYSCFLVFVKFNLFDIATKFVYEHRYKIAAVIVYIILVYLLYIGFYLRFKSLGVKLFWYDEFLSEERAFYSFKKIFSDYKTQRSLIFCLIMKFYSYIIFFINKANFMSEEQLRYPNVVIGTGSILIVFLICKKIRDYIAGITAAIICSFSYFLIFYSREGRYYPIFFLLAFLLLFSGISILIAEDRKKINVSYICYSLTASIGMYNHSGFWLLFAISNLFIALYEIFRSLIYGSESLLVKIKHITFRVGLLAVPLLISCPLFIHLTKSDAQRPISDGSRMIKELSYKTINNFSMSFWENVPFANYFLIIIILMGLFLFVISFSNYYKNDSIKIRITTLYLFAIKFIPFVFARFLPRSLIKEFLLPKYVIFILCADILIFSFFISCFLDYLFHFIPTFSKLKRNLLSLLVIVIFLFFWSFIYIPKIFDTDAFKPFIYLQSYVDDINKIYRPGSYILTDDLEFSCYLNHAQNAGFLPKDHCGFLGSFSEKTSIPDDVNNLIVTTGGQIDFGEGLFFLGNVGNIGKIVPGLGEGTTRKMFLIPINQKPTAILFMALISKSIKSYSKFSHLNKNTIVDSWREKYSNIDLNGIFNDINASTNLISNGDFSSGLNNWTNTTTNFMILSEGNYNFVRFNSKNPKCSDSLSQYFYISNGDIINIIFEARKSKSLGVKFHDNSNTIIFLNFYDENNHFYLQESFSFKEFDLNSNWRKFILPIIAMKDSKVFLQICYFNNSPIEIKNIRCNKFIFNHQR